jgi:hypothetical protein
MTDFVFGGPYRSYAETWGAGQSATDAEAKAREAHSRIEFLELELIRLSVVTEALWRVLQDAHGWDEKRLQAMVVAIEDARRREATEGGHPHAVPCAKCGRNVSRRSARCLYCGAEHAPDVFAR